MNVFCLDFLHSFHSFHSFFLPTNPQKKMASEANQDMSKKRKINQQTSPKISFHYKDSFLLRMLALGLCDQKSTFATLTNHRLYDKNIMIHMLVPYLFTGQVIHECYSDDIAFDHVNHRMYVLNSVENCVHIFTLNGKQWLGKFGSTGRKPLQFNRPLALAVHPYSFHLYITDSINHRVQVVDIIRTDSGVDCRFVREFGTFGVLKYPHGIACDPSTGLIFVSDNHQHDVFVFDSHDSLLYKFGQNGKQNRRIYYPKKIRIDPIRNEIFVIEGAIGNTGLSVFSASNGMFLRRICTTQSPHCFYPEDFVLSSNREIITSGSFSKRLLVFNRDTGLFVRTIITDFYTECININPKNNMIYIGSYDGCPYT